MPQSDNYLNIGTVLGGRYRVESPLASGGFGKTYLVKHLNLGKQYALKEFYIKDACLRGDDDKMVTVAVSENHELFDSQKAKFLKEARVLSELSDEQDSHIIRVTDLFEENGTAYYVMDYVRGESLGDRLERSGSPMSEAFVLDVLGQMLKALDVVHGAHLLHMDIKPANIMVDDKGKRVKEAGPSIPVEILGLNAVPNAGEVFIAHENDKTAKQFADTFIAQNKAKKLEETKSKMSLDDVFAQIKEGNLKELNLIVKADVQGSVEAVKQSLTKLSNDEVVVKCIHGGVGAINESDISLAAASNAIVIGFNVRIDATAKETAETEGVDVRLYKVIYQAIDDVEAAMKGLLDPVYEEKVIGHAEVRQIFKASAVGNIAGSYVLDGQFTRGCKIRITREGEQIYEGSLASLKRFKDDVKEVKAGFECGLVFEDFDAMQELDVVEAYEMVEVPR